MGAGGLLSRSLGRDTGAAQYRKVPGQQDSGAGAGIKKAGLRNWEELPDHPPHFHRECVPLACPYTVESRSNHAPHHQELYDYNELC